MPDDARDDTDAYVKFTNLATSTPEDWVLMYADHDRDREHLADNLLRTLAGMTGGSPPAPVDHLTHMLQTATRAQRAGADEETVVMALLHDIGDELAPDNHGEYAAAILRPYVSEENLWVARMHPVFQGYHFFDKIGLDKDMRERYRGHPAFEACCRFCDDWDQEAFDPGYDTLPLEAFAPMVRNIFGQEPRTWFDD